MWAEVEGGGGSRFYAVVAARASPEGASPEGVSSRAWVVIENSVISGNSLSISGPLSSHGGAVKIANNGTLKASNTTISGNSITGGAGAGGIDSGRPVELDSVTFAGNQSTPPSGTPAPVRDLRLQGSGSNPTTFKNTVFGSSGASGDNCAAVVAGILTSEGHNIERGGNSCGLDDSANSTDQPDTDPLLGDLADNGGPTETHALAENSPAIDKGDTHLDTDQRGEARPFDQPFIPNAPDGNGSDIGAFELREELAPEASLDPASLAFGDQRTETTSAPRTVTLSNTGAAPLTVNGVSLSDDTAGFSISDDGCENAVLAHDDECSVSVTFAPDSPGPKTADLLFDTDAPGEPLSVGLSGEGVEPVANVSPATLAFGTQRVNTSGPPQTATLANTGTAPLEVEGVGIAGRNPVQFPISSNGCAGKTLGPGESCNVSARFRPTSAGAKLATLEARTDVRAAPLSVSLRGAGQKAPTPPKPPKPKPNACTITGTPGNDVLRGTPGRDVICGLGGNDILRGGAGNDILIGGSGNDTLIGGPGRDILHGGPGRDRLDARDGVRGNDVANGGPGRDACLADPGDVKRNCP